MEKDKILIKQIENNILGIKLPKGIETKSYVSCGHLFTDGLNKPYFNQIKLPKGDWEPLGLLDELTEEQKEKLVIILLKYGICPAVEYSIDDHIEWFIELHQLYTVNPLGEKPEANKFNKSIGQIEVTESFLSKFKAWQEAENNTGSWLILILK